LSRAGTDEKAIVDVMAAHTNAQRQEIALSFKTQFGKVCVISCRLLKNKYILL